MRARLIEFVQSLRAAGVRISIAETLDAMAAVRTIGIEPALLREALCATLVKDESDRERFEETFAAFFAPPPGRAIARRGTRPGAGEPSVAGTGRGSGASAGAAPPPSPESRPAAPRPASSPRRTEPDAAKREKGSQPSRPRPESRRRAEEAKPKLGPSEAARRSAGGLAPIREIVRKPVRDLAPEELELARQVAREIGRRFASRAARRERRQRTGRIDIRRTIRASLSRGGAMLVLARRGRRPGKPHLVVLCDVSGSVALSSELFLAIVAAAESAFARISRFAYVDHLVAIDFADEQIRPDGVLDLHARSDLGTVLCELERNHATRLDRSTVLLVLGDGRNNRFPARADALKRLARRARGVVFAVAERRARWNTGDSALAAYAAACDLVLEADSLAGLAAALREVARR